MKTNILLLLLLIGFMVEAQNSGRGFHYQAVARDASGAIRKNELVVMEFTLYVIIHHPAPYLDSRINYWIERDSVYTDLNGIFSVTVGKGIVQPSSHNSNFSHVNFSRNDYFFQVSVIDPYNSYIMSDEKFQYVPYAENGTPLGIIKIFAGPEANIPPNWMVCDGRPLSVLEYPELFEVIGTNWGTPAPGSGILIRPPVYHSQDRLKMRLAAYSKMLSRTINTTEILIIPKKEI
ncbi:MAG: phage tail protein [Bacteroidetes bacterium]|nr:phage tail protein [Bacteroidota bacterium]